MIPLPLSLRNPYLSSIPAIVQPWIKPDRHSLIVFRHRWPPIRLFVVCSMLVLAVWPEPGDWRSWLIVLGVVAFYLCWQVSFDILEHHPQFSSTSWQHAINVVRQVGGITGLTAIIWYQPVLGAQLWLLYLVPLITIGVSLERLWAFSLILLIIVCAFLSALAVVRSSAAFIGWPVILREGMMRALISSYVGFTSYVLVRSLAYQSRANQLSVERLNAITPTTSWQSASNTIAQAVAEVFSDEVHEITANVLAHDPDTDEVTVIGSSVTDGQELVENGFRFSAGNGITGWAIRHGKPCFLNDTLHDPEQRFLHQNAFSGSRSALAVPVTLDERHVAVLEVESPFANDFAQEDLQLLLSMGGHLVASHRRNMLLEVHRRLAELGQDLAHRIIRVEEIPSMLTKIGQISRSLLDADIVDFYYRHPLDDEHWDRCTVGDVRVKDATGLRIAARHSLIDHLLHVREIRWYDDAQSDPHLTRLRPWHQQHGLAPFVIREGIVSCAVMPLVLGQECIGLMWINYRRRVEFTEPVKNMIQMLAPYAALAIQSGLQTALAEKARRDELQRIVHDSLDHHLLDVERGLDVIGTYAPGTLERNEELVIIHRQLKRARRVADCLFGDHPWLTVQSIVDDLRHQAELIERIHGIGVHLSLGDVPSTPISPVGGNELMFACDEILGNAVRHSRAHTISLAAAVDGRNLNLTFEDDGMGFDIHCARVGRGISNVHARAQNLGGTVQFCSQLGQGTQVHLCVPIPNSSGTRGHHNGDNVETRTSG